MQERNKNIDILRAMALLLIIVYHSWVVCGSQPIQWPVINMVIALGGEIGVTAFFALSGYGIYCSLHGMEKNGGISTVSFLVKRAVRIMPQYYLCLLIVILFSGGAVYLSWEHFTNIVTHVLFIHNFWPSSFGAINGVLWTMGITVQFYLIAVPLYKGMKKFGLWFWTGSIVATIVMKYVVYAFIIPRVGDPSVLNFIYGRQLFTALDNFVTGMAVAYFIMEKKKSMSKVAGIVVSIVSVILLLIICRLGQKYGIHSNNISGYIWHSGVAVALGFLMTGFSAVPINFKNIFSRAVLWIASYEYGIYLWHLVMFNNLIEKAPFIQQLIASGCRKVVFIIFMVLAIAVGILFTKLSESINWRTSKAYKN